VLIVFNQNRLFNNPCLNALQVKILIILKSMFFDLSFVFWTTKAIHIPVMISDIRAVP